MSKEHYDWIRYEGVFIKIRQERSGQYHATITEIMPDYPVRKMLMTTTFDQSNKSDQTISDALGTYSLNSPVDEEGEPKFTAAQQEEHRQEACRRQAEANRPWPMKAVLGILELTLYVMFVAIPLGIIGAIVYGIGHLFGAW